MTRLKIYNASVEYQMQYDMIELALKDKLILEGQGWTVEVMGNGR
jgi:hypothetical protein